VHGEVRRALLLPTGRLDATERQALVRLLERVLGSPPLRGPTRTPSGVARPDRRRSRGHPAI